MLTSVSKSLCSLPQPLIWLQPFDFPHKLGICERLFGQTIARYGVCWVQTGAQLSWKLDLTNPTHRWIVYGKYEGSAFLNWAKQFLPGNGIVVDSGANIGQMALYLAQYVPQGKVLSFEPGEAAADWLAECLTVHSTLPIEIIRRGLSSTQRQLRLNPVGGEVGYGHGAWSQISETEGEAITVVSLAAELAERSIEVIDLWKLDVEGHEIAALEGAAALLQPKRIRSLYVELIGDNGQNIQQFLQQFGYTCHLFDSRGKLYRPTQLPLHTNGLFLPC